jgi:putative CocE/NonD family hydrolase
MRFEAPDPKRWVPDGYVIIHADSRGAGASPGMLDAFSPRETEDLATLITWAAHHSWSSGKVGLLGTSYHSINQWQVAAREKQGLASMMIRIAQKKGVSAYVEDGHNRWPAVHRLDAVDNPTSSRFTEERLGWRPTQPGLIPDLDHARYFEA